MWCSPLKPPKEKKEKTTTEKDVIFPKVKAKIKPATAKRVVGAGGVPAAQWLERWIEQFVRENSLPPQLLSDDFPNQLTHLLAPKDALDVLSRVRADYARAFPLTAKPEKEDLDWLGAVIAMDASEVSSLPPQYL
jgi:hypothetical protein